MSALNILPFRGDVSLSSCDSSKVNDRILNFNEVVTVINVVFFRTLNSYYTTSSSRCNDDLTFFLSWSDFRRHSCRLLNNLSRDISFSIVFSRIRFVIRFLILLSFSFIFRLWWFWHCIFLYHFLSFFLLWFQFLYFRSIFCLLDRVTNYCPISLKSGMSLNSLFFQVMQLLFLFRIYVSSVFYNFCVITTVVCFYHLSRWGDYHYKFYVYFLHMFVHLIHFSLIISLTTNFYIWRILFPKIFFIRTFFFHLFHFSLNGCLLFFLI